MSAAGVSAPAHLTAEHDVADFDSGTPELDNWLKRRALANEALGTSRTYVVTAGDGGRVVAFYALANGAVAHKDVSAKAKRNMPDPIPVMVLARLAVDSAYQKQGLGSALLKDALLRTIAAAQIAGIRAVLLHAMSDDAKRFYERAGFHECPVDPMMMMITLAEVEKNLAPPSAS
jgi:GNAT superfamily N-acetyltransferase